MLKNRRSGNPMPIYLVNLLPRANFNTIHEIKELCNISVEVLKFNGSKVTALVMLSLLLLS